MSGGGKYPGVVMPVGASKTNQKPSLGQWLVFDCFVLFWDGSMLFYSKKIYIITKSNRNSVIVSLNNAFLSSNSYCTTHLFKVYKSFVFSIFAELCNYP